MIVRLFNFFATGYIYSGEIKIKRKVFGQSAGKSRRQPDVVNAARKIDFLLSYEMEITTV